MKINTNMSAFITNKQLLRIENNLAGSMERLSSGLKLNHAKDNPAGMAISNKMRAQIDGLDRASENASDGISVIRIADGALNETSSVLQRMRELAVQAASDTNSLEDKQAVQREIEDLKKEITRISTDTEYNQLPLLDGSLSTRVYADHVSRISISDEVKPGNYSLTILSAAQQAEVAGDAGFGTGIDADVTLFGVSGTFSVNGATVEIKETDTYSEVYQKIRDTAEIGEAEMNLTADGRLDITSTAFGGDAEVKLEFSDMGIASALGFNRGLVTDDKTGKLVYGTKDASGKITGVKGVEMDTILARDTADSEFSDTATVKKDGNRVTITDKNGFKMSFLLEEGFQKDANANPPESGVINLEVTDIGTMTLHIGANKDQNMEVSIPRVSSESLYIDDLDVTTVKGADRAITRLDEAIAEVSAVRSKIGAYENRLDYSTASLDTYEENITDALSRLSDTDMADEMTTYTQQNILSQATISVLTQANDLPQQVLQLLQ